MQKKCLQTVAKNNKSIENIQQLTNIFQLECIKTKIKQTFTNKYGDGIINPGQVFNRKKGYDNFLKNIYVQPLFSYDEYNEMCKHIDRYHNKNLLWKCCKCGYEFRTNVKRKPKYPDGIHATTIVCPKCFHYKGSSIEELELFKYIKTIYLGKIERNNRTILSKDLCSEWKGKHEIDIWLPELNKAIEFNGTFYHMDPRFYNSTSLGNNGISANEIWHRDQLKLNVFNKLKIKYLIIWQEDWRTQNQICKQQILEFIQH